MKLLPCTLPLLFLFAAAPAVSDDVSGSRHLLCTTIESHVCEPGGCAEFDAADLSIPRFITIDTRSRTLATTEASGENRSTVAETLTREDGHLLLQGLENHRAYSLLIDEASGAAFFAAAGLGLTVTSFGACTPAPGQ